LNSRLTLPELVFQACAASFVSLQTRFVNLHYGHAGFLRGFVSLQRRFVNLHGGHAGFLRGFVSLQRRFADLHGGQEGFFVAL